VIETGGGRGLVAPDRKGVPQRAGHRRLPGVDLRPGAVKQARKEAGLSLALVGKGCVTAPAIYLIETGRTRPSLPTLEHIARKTGKSVEFFLADPSGNTDETKTGLIELEAMVAEGRYEEAIALGGQLLNLGTSAHRLGQLRYLLAQAHLQLGKPDKAASLLRDAHGHFESVDDALMLAECIGSEARVASMTQKPEAFELAERALAICRGMKHVPAATEARLLAILATVHVANQEWDAAIRVYEEAIQAAGSLFDLGRMAKMYSGLSGAYRETGHVEAAVKYAGRSIALLEVLRDRISLAQAENNLGLILLAQGDRGGAHKHLDRSLELAEEANLEVGRSHVLMSLCELSLAQGNVQAARQFADQALAMAERMHEAANVAEAHVWLGRVADEVGDDELADTEFGIAIRGLTEVGVEERLLRCHGIYAEILEKRGELKSAYEHMKKAFSASRPGLLQGAGDETEERATSA
jgi:tetratricopeptide (TPR) repeat protein/DNA-binding XRE family transcriptional regulator